MSSADQAGLIALIPTADRPELLISRALRSVANQTLQPCRIVVVDDSPSAKQAVNLERRLNDLGMRIEYLANRRTKGLSGAVNSGLDHCLRSEQDPARVFVAMLDDDDAWEPEHLKVCLETALAGNLDMVASGLIRHEEPDGPGHHHAIPQKLDARQQFIEGQHIQGSNLFVRLNFLLLAGGFDEYLPSCTDRDLCIRLAEIPTLRFGATSLHTVRHYADRRNDRLSAPSSESKHRGLTRFWRKYAGRFGEVARNAAADRALRLFGWPVPEVAPIVTDVPPLIPSTRQLALVAGFVTDAIPKPHVEGLLGDLLALRDRPDIASLSVVIVENGPIPEDDDRPLHDLVSRYSERGLATQLISIEKQRSDWARGELIDTPDPSRQRLPIAVTRTILNTYVARLAAQQPGAAAWILDDDKRLSVRIAGGGEEVVRESPDVDVLLTLRDRGVDVVIGPDTESAPLPFIATLRLQLLDLWHLVASLEGSSPSDPWKEHSAEDREVRATLKDSYYDLSKQTEHLETPFSMPPPIVGATLANALEVAASRVDRLLAGESVFRPLALESNEFTTGAAVESVHRGGSTIFFHPEHLMEYPQTIARFGDRFVRRSDMLISLLMRDQLGLKIVRHASAGVWHERSFTSRCQLGDGTLGDDVLGYALYRTADELMQCRPVERSREPLVGWSPEELKNAIRLVKKYTDERLSAFMLGAWRIRGLTEILRHAARRLLTGTSAWSCSAATDHFVSIAEEMDRIYNQFDPSAITKLAERIRGSISNTDISNTFASMDGLISEYRATRKKPSPTDVAMSAVRELRARSLLERVVGAKRLRVLGAGGEGVVLTDEKRVFKVFDLQKRRPNHDTSETLRALSESLNHPNHLYPLEFIDCQDDTLLIAYPYEETQPYFGGRGAELLGLLRECKSHGIVFRNLHPKNVRVSATGLKLVDYGADIRPYSESGYRSMAERAWLTWRWPRHPNLDEIMRRALADKSLPELEGFALFWRALNDEQPSATRIVSESVERFIRASAAMSVLDYGCGKKAWSVRRLAEAGLHCVGYDPGADMPGRWQALGELPAELTLTTDRASALEQGPFDAVISSLVLCEVGNGPDYEQILQDIRAAVRPNGLVIITVCNPLATFGGPTNLHRRRDLPITATYDDSFWYTESAETGMDRVEFHRPLARIERDLLRHGLQVEQHIASDTIDIERFEPASDFMTLVCRPLPVPRSGPSVSLLIKTCAMEASTIERQVAHLVSQLEGPRVFVERLLVLDSRRDGFVRQHADASMEDLVCAAERLRSRGVIDRVLFGPEVGATARNVMRDWFDLECDRTHTEAGAPLAAPLWGMEQCGGDYILQVDSDLLVHRGTRTDDYLGEMIDALERAPQAITASLSVPQANATPFTATKDDSPWRVEVRGSLFHKARLLGARPFPNQLNRGIPTLSWHRSIDVAVKGGRVASLRGASAQTGFVHPPNKLKENLPEWMLLLDLVEHYPVPTAQLGKVDLVGDSLLWTPRNRAEPYIFLVTGRNVPPGRIAKCIESMASQRKTDWGAVIIDDGSDTLAREALRHSVQPWGKQITLIQPRERRGQLANMTLAIRHVCTNPRSVIITLDLDDALLGPGVLDRLDREYAAGAEVTIGSMLRTDKHAEYPVTLDQPRKSRGGNVWQHLRTFRKYLFDAIPDDYLRIDGRYVDIAVDWSFMLPIVEMANQKVWIREPLYLYEPSGLGKGQDSSRRENQIAAIMAKPPCRPLGDNP